MTCILPTNICENCIYWNGTVHEVTADCTQDDRETDFDDTCPKFKLNPSRQLNCEVAK